MSATRTGINRFHRWMMIQEYVASYPTVYQNYQRWQCKICLFIGEWDKMTEHFDMKHLEYITAKALAQ